jgi:hypothetical protein
MRAVSSPSLTDTPVEAPTSASPSYSSKPNGAHPELNERGQPTGGESSVNHPKSLVDLIILSSPTASSGSVLQKFKKTFFKNGKSNLPAVDIESNETKHHR